MILLGPKYVAVLDSQSLLAAVGDEIGVADASIRSSTDAQLQSGTLVLEIRFSSNNGEFSARAANALSDALIRKTRDDKLVYAVKVASAVPPSGPSIPTITQLHVLGVVGGAGLALALAVGTNRRWPSFPR
jgi:uncharacterized protein involved in exopolysaccharide biosynthesis